MNSKKNYLHIISKNYIFLKWMFITIRSCGFYIKFNRMISSQRPSWSGIKTVQNSNNKNQRISRNTQLKISTMNSTEQANLEVLMRSPTNQRWLNVNIIMNSVSVNVIKTSCTFVTKNKCISFHHVSSTFNSIG